MHLFKNEDVADGVPVLPCQEAISSIHWDWKDAFLDKEELEGMPGISFLYMRNPGLKKDLC